LASEGFTRVLREVGDQVVRECEEIIGKALEDAEEILKREMELTLQEVREVIEDAERRSEMTVSRTLSLAEVRARGRLLEAMENYVTRVIEEAVKKIKESAERGELKEEFKNLLLEAIEAVGRDDVKAYTSEELKRFLRETALEIEREKKIKIRIQEEPVETIFGVVVKSVDGSVSFDNRIETRIDRLRSQIKREVAALIR